MERKKHIFTPSEKKCFLGIIKKYNAVIENKETDSACLKTKNVAWSRIAAEYNNSPYASSQATTKQLRRLWMNMKQRQREAMKARQQRWSTRGDPSICDPSMQHISQASPALGIDTASSPDPLLEIKKEMSILPLFTEVIVPMRPEPLDTSEIPMPASSNSSQTQPNSAPTEHRDSVFGMPCKDPRMRINEKHEMEMMILHEQLREAKAKADLAELVLRRQRHCSVISMLSRTTIL